MVAETLSAPVAEPVPTWVYPPGGFTAEKFLKLEGLPKHTQLIDGSLVFVSPQTSWHVRVINLLLDALDRQAPPELRADREMSVRLAVRQVPEPDVLVVAARAYDREQPFTFYNAADVLLAVEVVSADSVERDRDTKPRRYAAAGIKYFWRVEHEQGRTVVYAYEIDPATGGYGLGGIYHDRLVLSVPYDIDIDLTKVGARPPR
ncbi:Uma2 family endonuclease [Jiangella alkaliphila]|uniref:Endonuclease, Uma2 family (Restriction endonuclease fold) n=1 Tax=Jiangella alkaliphila TaxID=419479 RepID=A0A1H2M604_9ACTN|nr:Uma2 family endonuclease [Jiangella alkaliphila]SDU88690.1 Endonuclease, Uma2 family (restriction endonuclease fold) [Jiangella alkaliphila]